MKRKEKTKEYKDLGVEEKVHIQEEITGDTMGPTELIGTKDT